MKFTYESTYNIAYLKLRDKVDEVQTIQISDELSVDMSSDGTIFGIEFLNAQNQLNTALNQQIPIITEKLL